MSERDILSIDTNILLRHLLQDHDDHSPRASALLRAVRAGDVRIFCPATVIFETIHVLHGRVKIPRADVSRALANLIALPNFIMEQEAIVTAALEFWVAQSPLAYADCYHLALTKALGMSGIYTFDQKMDRYPGIARVEP